MNTMIQCPHCYEETNSADWEACHGHCHACGREIDSPTRWVRSRRTLSGLLFRLECRPTEIRSIRPHPRTVRLMPERRLYA